MSLAKTLIKVAIGVAVAKGVSTLVKGGASGRTTNSDDHPNGIEDIMEGIGSRRAGKGRRYDRAQTQENESEDGLGDLLGELTGQSAGNAAGKHGNKRRRHNAPKRGLEDMLADDGQGAGQSGGLGDLLDQLTKTSTTGKGRTGAGRAGANRAGRSTQNTGNGGGLDDLLGQLPGGDSTTRSSPQTGGGLGDLLGAVLGSLGGAAVGGATADAATSDRVTTDRATTDRATSGAATADGTASDGTSSRHQDLAAALILRAMVAAAKADGELDADEKRKLTEQADDASREEIAFITAELDRRTDVETLASQVPEGMEAQVYIMSLMAIDLDNQREAQHLDQLAKALSLDPREVNALHDRAGVQRLYS